MLPPSPGLVSPLIPPPPLVGCGLGLCCLLPCDLGPWRRSWWSTCHVFGGLGWGENGDPVPISPRVQGLFILGSWLTDPLPIKETIVAETCFSQHKDPTQQRGQSQVSYLKPPFCPLGPCHLKKLEASAPRQQAGSPWDGDKGRKTGGGMETGGGMGEGIA